MLSVLSSGSLQLLKENGRQRKNMRCVENHNASLQNTIIVKGQAHLDKIGNFACRLKVDAAKAFRDIAFIQWKRAVRMRHQQVKVQRILIRHFSVPIARTAFSLWAHLLRIIRKVEHQKLHNLYVHSQDKYRQCQESLEDVHEHRDELQKQAHFLIEERAHSLATIQTDSAIIAGLEDSLSVERKKNDTTQDSAAVWESKYRCEVEDNVLLREQNTRLEAELNKIRSSFQRRKERIRARTLKHIANSERILLKEAFRAWAITQQRASSVLIKPLEQYGIRVAELEMQLIETKQYLRHADQVATEAREHYRHLEELNHQLEADLYDFIEGKGVRHFFRCFDLPGIILSMFRRLVVLGQKVQTPALGNADNEHDLLVESIRQDMCTHRPNKVSTKHEFQMYVERLYLTGVPPTHLTQVLCLLLGIDFSSPVSAPALEKKLSVAEPAFNRLIHAWWLSWDTSREGTRGVHHRLAQERSTKNGAPANHAGDTSERGHNTSLQRQHGSINGKTKKKQQPWRSGGPASNSAPPFSPNSRNGLQSVVAKMEFQPVLRSEKPAFTRTDDMQPTKP
eukprot:GEMP01007700.1.p1 GENE.GEMP01007700.1~~GEMP01007700.1.p1  ORF type:complete len:567 (+),score=125.49 GEMP01007700.1:528-2228(+)